MSSRDHMQNWVERISSKRPRRSELRLLHRYYWKDEEEAAEEEEKRSSIIYDPSILPEELILFHILGYLPVKSIGRFRCVSRLWNSFLNSKRFIYNMHLSNAKPYPFTIHQYGTVDYYKSYLFNFQESHAPNLFYNFSDQSYEFCERRGLLMFVENKKEGIVSCLSSLNGLLCLKIKMTSYDIYNPIRPFLRVINPVTREFLNIGLEGFKDHGNICQLIFDPSSDDDQCSNIEGGGGGGHYKLLMVYNRDAPSSSSSKPKAMIITLGVDKRWRIIKGPIFNGCDLVHENRSLPFVNGSVHWLWGWESSEEILERRKDYQKGLVIAFNVRDEKLEPLNLRPIVLSPIKGRIMFHILYNLVGFFTCA